MTLNELMKISFDKILVSVWDKENFACEFFAGEDEDFIKEYGEYEVSNLGAWNECTIIAYIHL